MSIEFLVTPLIIVAVPGTGVIYTLAAGHSRGARASTVAALGCTLLLNSKLALFFVAFLPQFVSANAANEVLSMLELSGVFMLLTFVVFVIYGALSAMVRTHVIGST